jgi:hypothetical protein
MDSNVTEFPESVAISWLSCLEILMFTCSLVRMFNGLSLKSDINFMDETLALVFDVVPIHLHKIGFKDSYPQLFLFLTTFWNHHYHPQIVFLPSSTFRTRIQNYQSYTALHQYHTTTLRRLHISTPRLPSLANKESRTSDSTTLTTPLRLYSVLTSDGHRLR